VNRALLLAFGFLPAAGIATAAAGSPVQAPDTVLAAPFEIVRNQIVLEVDVGGRGPFRMLLDTAGEPSAVDLATALREGFPVDTSTSGEASGAGGESVRIFAAELPEVRIGGVPLGDVDAVALDLSRIGERMEMPIHGVLGYSLLAGRIVEIDYPASILRVFAASPPRPEHVVPLRFRAGRHQPLVPIRIAGEEVTVTLDTGSSLSLELDPEVARRLGLGDLVDAGAAGTVVGARGEAAVVESRVAALALGPFELTDVEVAFRPFDGDERTGNLGNGVLRHFVLTLDYPGGWIGFERAAASGSGPAVTVPALLDLALVDRGAFARRVTAGAGSDYERAVAVTRWFAEHFDWTATDYEDRTVEQILERGGGNCDELARVTVAMLEELGLPMRRVREINIHLESQRRQRSAEAKVAESGIGYSVFGRRHNDHVWIEVQDRAGGEWFPADPSMGVVGDQWLESRLSFGERFSLDGGSVAMIAPFAVFAQDADGGFTVNRTAHYVIEGFDRLYGGRLRGSPAWDEWVAGVDRLDDLAGAAFRAEANLHAHADVIDRLAESYEALRAYAAVEGLAPVR
jgi:predicted aspartyl protease